MFGEEKEKIPVVKGGFLGQSEAFCNGTYLRGWGTGLLISGVQEYR